MANTVSQVAELKSQTSSLIKVVQENADFLVAASLAKTIPSLEHRIKRLEEDADRKRNWRVNGWLLALTIISTAAAVWALFIR
jgi:hypothetical protein